MNNNAPSSLRLPTGMALISMCIQMMQDQIVSKVRWAAEEAGMVDSEARLKRRKAARRSREGTVPETDPYDYRPLSGENRRRRRQRMGRAEEEREEGREGQRQGGQEDGGRKQGKMEKKEEDGAKKQAGENVSSDEDMELEGLFNLA